MLVSFQLPFTDGQFVSSNFFPVSVLHWHLFSSTFLFPFCIFLSLSHFLILYFLLFFLLGMVFHLNMTYTSHPFACYFHVIYPVALLNFSVNLYLFPSLLFVCFLATSMFFCFLLCHSCLMSPHILLFSSLSCSLFFSVPVSSLLLSLAFLYFFFPSFLCWSQNYFKDAWNIFDCVTVLGSITDILVTELGVSTRFWGVCVQMFMFLHSCIEKSNWKQTDVILH